MPNINIPNLSPTEFIAAFENTPDALLLDVRTQMEYNDAHLKGADLIDIKQASFIEEAQELDKQKAYFIYCKVGVRSLNACMYFRTLGIEKVYNLSGGIYALNAEPTLASDWVIV